MGVLAVSGYVLLRLVRLLVVCQPAQRRCC